MSTSSALSEDERYMQIALKLAAASPAAVSPNPGVGAVIVAEGRVIGQGATQVDGGPHAEVLAIRSVSADDRHLVRSATIYVTLEPCSIYGRTPPCSRLLVDQDIGRVVVGCLDFTPGVCGKGLEELRRAGCKVVVGCLQEQAFFLHRHRHVFVRNQRPYIILKQALGANGEVGCRQNRLLLTGDAANRESHQWRADSDAILVGVGTVVADDPSLSVRRVDGKSPLRVVLDPNDRAPRDAKVFTDGMPTLHVVSNSATIPSHSDAVEVLRFEAQHLLEQLLQELYVRRIGRLLVEGGPATLRTFINAKYFDECREWRSPVSADCAEPIQGVQMPVTLDLSERIGADELWCGFATDRVWSLKSA